MWKNYVRFFTALMIVASVYTSALGQSKAFDVANMDRSADACDNFFQFADGNWVKNTPIPPSQSRWGSFNMLSESNRDVLHDILEKAEKEKAAAGSNVQMIGDFYASCMDEAAIEKAGPHPLDAEFGRINKINTVDDLKREIAELHRQGLPALFRFGGGPDQRNSNMVILNAGQGGLSLPNKEYYTLDTPSMTATRTKFVEHMTNMFKLLGDSPEAAAANAKTVMDVQTRLANASMAPDQLRNRDKNYNKITLADAQAIIPNFSLADYMKAFGPSFVGLTGSEAAIKDVEKKYRVYAAKKPLENGNYGVDHSSVLYLMGPDGKLVNFYDEAVSPDDLAKDLRQRT